MQHKRFPQKFTLLLIHEWCLLFFCSSTVSVPVHSSSLHVKEHIQQKIRKIKYTWKKNRVSKQCRDFGASWGHHNVGHDHIRTSKVQRVSLFVPPAPHAQLLPRFTSVPLFSSLFSADIWESHWLACEQKLRLHNVSHPHRLSLRSSQCPPVLPSLSLFSQLDHTHYYQTLFTTPPETEASARD